MSNLAKFDNTIAEFGTEVNKLKEIGTAYQKLKGLSDSFDGLNREFVIISERLKTGHQKIEQGIKDLAQANSNEKQELAKLIEQKLDLLRKENKDFYKELESTIKLKLNDNKSEIRQLIENERKRIKDIFEIEFAKNTLELKKAIETESARQTGQLLAEQRVIKQSVWLLGGLILVILLLHAFKLLPQ